MNYLLVLIIALTSSLSNSNHSTFDIHDYSLDDGIIAMLEDHFAKEFHSKDLYEVLGDYLSYHIDEIESISGHFDKQSNMYYYAVFGKFEGLYKVKLLEISPFHFNNGTFYNFESALAFGNLCRKGNGNPYPVCPPVCDEYLDLCVGIECPPIECH